MTPSPSSSCEHHTELHVIEIYFKNNHVVDNDAYGTFGSPEWKEGRAADAAHFLPEQYPVCYTRNRKIKLNVKLKVVKAPSCTEDIWVKGIAEIQKGRSMVWAAKITVKPSDSEVLTGDMESNISLPDHVTYFESFLVAWISNHGTGPSTRKSAGASRNPLYVVLGDPNGTPAYWTLLAVSCKAATGRTEESKFVPAMYKGFQGAQKSPPAPIRRKRDEKILRYWQPEADEIFTTYDMLANTNGSGRCGAWSLLMVDMCKVHGITSAVQVAIEYSSGRNPLGMLVKNWSFSSSPDIAAPVKASGYDFTHYVGSDVYGNAYKNPSGGGCRDELGVPAQGNPDPMPAFYDHAIVKHNGTYYDPSYGTAPVLTPLNWEKGSLDGIFVTGSNPSSGAYVSVAARHPGSQVFDFSA